MKNLLAWLIAARAKQGQNDLSRWREFGGTLERPDRPSPFRSLAAPGRAA